MGHIRKAWEGYPNIIQSILGKHRSNGIGSVGAFYSFVRKEGRKEGRIDSLDSRLLQQIVTSLFRALRSLLAIVWFGWNGMGWERIG